MKNMRSLLFIAALLIGHSLSSCTLMPNNKQQEAPAPPPPTFEELLSIFGPNDYFANKPDLDMVVDSLYRRMTWRQRIAQTIVGSIGHPGQTVENAIELVNGQKIGGIILFADTRENMEANINKLKLAAQTANCPPLIFSIDAEPSLFKSRITNPDLVLSVPHTRAINTTDQARLAALQITNVLKKTGFQQNFAPVADNGSNQAVIGNRAFGNDTAQIIELAVAFIKQTQNLGLAACAKHFPGHGLIDGDSHKRLVQINGTAQEVPVFEKILKLGQPLSVMTGHIAIVNNHNLDTDGQPATLSPVVVKRLLRDSLGYQGVVITDAMNMGAVSTIPNAPFKALLAGNDQILMPAEPAKLHWQILGEMSASKALEQQIEASVKRVIRLKVCLGLYKQ